MLLQVDARNIPLTDNSVQCVVTSPPYWGLRDYGVSDQIGLEKTPQEYVEQIVAVFREVKRVLRDNGTVFLNLGDSYAGHNLPGWRKGNETKNGGISNKNGVGYVPGLKPKDLIGIPWRVAFALQADGWWLRSDIIWSKPNPMPESVTDRPTKSHEYIFLLAKNERYYFDQDAVREPPANYERKGGTACYTADGFTTNGKGSNSFHQMSTGGRNIRTVWEMATQPFPEAHFACFPEELATRCILASCPVGSVVLDPFCGSGTVIQVAQFLGRAGIGLDINPDYLAMAQRRVARTLHSKALKIFTRSKFNNSKSVINKQGG